MHYIGESFLVFCPLNTSYVDRWLQYAQIKFNSTPQGIQMGNGGYMADHIPYCRARRDAQFAEQLSTTIAVYKHGYLGFIAIALMHI